MGGTTIRRLANPIGWDASVQRFVIPAADVLRVLILTVQPDEVEHVFALNRACRQHVTANLTDELPVRLKQACRCLLPNSTTA